MEESSTKSKKERVGGRSLIDFVFSWSIKDVLNKDFYKNKVPKIPETFSTISSYMNAFVPSLLEEIHADLLSSIVPIPRGPTCEILTVEAMKDHNPPKDLFYEITCKEKHEQNGLPAYQPEVGDLIALTDVKPKCIDDLNRPQNPYLIAYVFGTKSQSSGNLLILASKLINTRRKSAGRKIKSKSETLFAVCLVNMTTNVRVWRALNKSELGANTNLLQNVLQEQQPHSSHGLNSCTFCSFNEKFCPSVSFQWTAMCSDLNDSQNSAVLNFISMSKCHHQNTVKLIWGPPGTGKTKTVGLSLFALLKLKCRTLTCAPTNIAVLEVTTRLLELIKQSFHYGKYGLGDIILFGNRGRLKVDKCDNLLEVFLGHRAQVLSKCFAPLSGWKYWLESMIGLLEDPKKQYLLYLQSMRERHKSHNDSGENTEDRSLASSDDSLHFTSSDDNRNSSSDDDMDNLTFEEFVKKKQDLQSLKKTREIYNDDSDNSNSTSDDDIVIFTFEEFLKEKLNYIGENLKLTMVSLYTHLPTSCISLKVVKDMVIATELLNSVESFLCQGHDISSVSLQSASKDCVHLLRSLRALSVPYSNDGQTIRNLCMQNACLLFCTASSSAKLYTKGMKPLELLVIDEAAQLKECESAIPLQLPGLRHAMLIGDERQLSAMVRSKISEDAGFGRSLFERLVQLGHEKHLLNVQYRMHPTISFFPKKQFYNNQISDCPNVKSRSYEKSFLEGKMYGSYSFINISNGKEEFDRGRSLINMVEVAVVYQIVSSLYKEYSRTKKKVSVGIISPYKAQVNAIEKIIREYTEDYLAGGDFSVSVRSADGFQGGEGDVIIISTVRCNGNGSIGFLLNHQRTNVMLTRARHCLWILGNGDTLSNSNSIWKKLITDAKSRNCFYNAGEDNKLSLAMATTFMDLGQTTFLLDSDSMLFRNGKWKASFANEFNNSLAKMKDPEVCSEIISLLRKLSDGWRQSHKTKFHAGTSGQLLEKYEVNGLLNLIWTVDILQETAQYVQIIKIWDLVQLSDVPKLAKRLDSIFESYTVQMMNRCKEISVEGDIVVPVRWPVEHLSSSSESDHLEFLSTPLSGLSLSDKPAEESTATHDRHRRGAEANGSRPRKEWVMKLPPGNKPRR